ncbi:MAG: LysM peptidoglycan-binding domain-containing protein [Pseudobutyrivibrio sp.]|nr:LysM peptidoglycan-binding domain-containing protein [Pseudobutyrivibrio sp.]
MSRAEVIVRNRKIALSMVLLVSVIVAFVLFTTRADAENSREVYTYYTSYEIQPGDTLWTIVDQFMGPDFTDKDDFINNIKKINHISGDDITSGKYLVIQYSSYECL